MNKDMVDGAIDLEKRFLQRVRSMTLEQMEDAGGVLSILHRELMKMTYEWSDETIAEFDRMSKNKTVDLI